MSDVIAYLDFLGGSATTTPDAARLAANLGIEPDAQAAIAARDSARLARLLGGRAFMACSIMAPDADEPLPDEQPATPEDVPGEGDVRAA